MFVARRLQMNVDYSKVMKIALRGAKSKRLMEGNGGGW